MWVDAPRRSVSPGHRYSRRLKSYSRASRKGGRGPHSPSPAPNARNDARVWEDPPEPYCKIPLDKIAEMILAQSHESDVKRARTLEGKERDCSEKLEDDTIRCPDCGGVPVYIGAEIPTLLRCQTGLCLFRTASSRRAPRSPEKQYPHPSLTQPQPSPLCHWAS